MPLAEPEGDPGRDELREPASLFPKLGLTSLPPAAVVGFLLPAFAFAAITRPLIPGLRNSPASLLDVSFYPFPSALAALAALAVLIRFEIDSAWLVVDEACSANLHTNYRMCCMDD